MSSSIRRKVWAAAFAGSVVWVMAFATPAFAGSAFLEGTVTDAVSHAPLGAIQVDIWRSGGYHLGTLFTDASGHYVWQVSFVGPSLVTRVTFTDSKSVYGPAAYGGGVNMLEGSDVTLTDGAHPLVNAALQKGVTFNTTVTRTGHPYTKLPGVLVGYTWNDYTVNAFYQGYTSAAGTHSLVGATGSWSIEADDPSVRFGSAYAPNPGATYAAGSIAPIAIQLPLLDSAQDVAISVPAAKASQKRGKSFSATGVLSKRVTSAKSVKILAIKGSTTKLFLAKVTAKSASATYKANVKLSKGTWRLVALFSGTGALAPTDSVTARTVKVK